MKYPKSFARIATFCFVLCAFTSNLFGQTTYYWETAGLNDGTLVGGTGTWNSANTFFTTSSTDAGTAIAWPTGAAINNRNTVVFGGTTGSTVTLSALTAYTPTGGSSTTTDTMVNNLTFATPGYVLGGNTIRFVYNGTTNGSITVNSGVTATINNAINSGATAGLVNGTASGNISNNVLINGGGTLNLGGGNSNGGFTIDGATTVQVTGGAFSGFNLNTINNASLLRATASNVLQAPASYTTTAGTGTLDLTSTTQTISTLGGNLAVNNSNATGILSLSLVGNTLTHTGAISNGTGKLSLATTGTFAQGSGFNSTNGFATQTLAGSNTYTGFTSLGRGTVVLDFNNAAAPASNILYNAGFGTPTGDDGKLIITRSLGSVVVPNAAIGSLATLTIAGKANTATTQQFNGLKMTDGAANVLLNPNGTGSVTLNLGPTLERSAGSLINFASNGTLGTGVTATAFSGTTLTFSTTDVARFSVGMTLSGGGFTNQAITAVNYSTGVVTLAGGTATGVGAVTATGGITVAPAGNVTIQTGYGTANSVLKDANGNAFAVLGGRNWAAKDATNANVVAATYTNSTSTAFAANADIAIPVAAGATNDVRLNANSTISTLKYGDSARSGINLGGTTLTTGGILTSQANTSSGNYIGNGSITSPGASGSDIVMYSNTSNYFGLNASLVDGAAATGFTKGGAGFILQNANNTFTGTLTVNEGGLVVRGTNASTGININGSQNNLTGTQLPSAGLNTTGAYVQLGNADTTGSLGTGNINLGANALLGIKRSDSFTLNNNTLGAGGITQGWTGTTTLLSAATAKYNHVGDTAVTAGTLKLDFSASDTGIINDNSRLVLGGGTVEYATAAGTTQNDAVRDFILVAGASTITKTGAGSGRLRLNTFSDGSQAGSTLNITAAGIADSDSSNTVGLFGSRARVTVGSGGTYDWATTVTSGANNTSITAYNLYSALATTAGSDTLNALQDLTAITSFTGSRTTNSLKLTNSSGASQSLDIAAGNTLTLTSGGLLVTGNSAVTIDNGTLRSLTAGSSDLIIHQYNSGGLTINSTVSNGLLSSTLSKAGDGVLTLTAANTYSGQTFINGGKLSVSSNANLGTLAAGTIGVATSATNSTSVTLVSPSLPTGFQVGSALLGQTVSSISGINVTLSGNANATISSSSAAAYTTGSGINLNNGTLLATNTFSLGTTLTGTRDRAIILNGVGGTIEVTGANVLTSTGTIGGPGGLTKTGTGVLALANTTNTYAGPTNVSEGTLRFTTGANLTRSNVTVASGATLEQAGASNFIGSLSGAGTVTNTGVSATLTIGTTHADSTFSGLLTNTTNALNIDKMGGGTLTITGATNNYTGSTTISGGSLVLSGAGALPDTTAVNVSSAAATFDISGISGTSETIRTLAGANASSVVLGAKNLAIGDDFGTVNVTSATTTGTVPQQSDIVVASVPSYLTVGSSILGRTVTAITGNTITLNGTANSNITVSTPITVYPTTGDTTYAGVISGVGGTITKDGSGQLTLSGANTYTGLTTIDRGAIVITNANGLGTTDAGTRINYNGNNSGGRLDINGITLNENVTLAGGRFNNNFGLGFRAIGGTTSTLVNTLTLEGGGPGVSATNSEFRIGTTTANTVLNLDAGVTRSGTSATNTGGLLFSAGASSTINVNAAIDNNGGGLTFSDSGTTVLKVVSTDVGSAGIDYGGSPLVTGNVKLGINNALPAANTFRIGFTTGNTSTDANGPRGRLDMAGFDLTVGRLEGSRGATTVDSAQRVITNTTTGNSTLTIGAAATNQTFDGVIENGGAGGTVAITKVLENTQTFSGDVANTYTGLTTVNGGSLILAKNAGLNAIGGNIVIGDGATTVGNDIVQLTNSNQIANTSLVSFSGTGTNAGILRLNNQNETIGGLSSSAGAGIVENNNATAGTSLLTSNVASGSTVFSGILRNNAANTTNQGVLAFTKDGAGTQVFTGASSYTGATIVNAGTLLANNATGSALGASNVTVEAAGTFGGTGSITGLVALNGGVLSPGASIESLTVGGLSGTGSLLIEYDGSAGQQIDFLDVAGNIDATGITLNFASLGAALADPFYVFAKYSGTLTGTFAAINAQPAGYLIDYDYLGNKEIALVTAVPEPGTIALLVVAGIGGGLYRRSRNSKKDSGKA